MFGKPDTRQRINLSSWTPASIRNNLPVFSASPHLTLPKPFAVSYAAARRPLRLEGDHARMGLLRK